MAIGISGLGYQGAGALDVERALRRIAGVYLVYVDPDTEMAYVQYDPSKVLPDDLAAAVHASGFGVESSVHLG